MWRSPNKAAECVIEDIQITLKPYKCYRIQHSGRGAQRRRAQGPMRSEHPGNTIDTLLDIGPGL